MKVLITGSSGLIGSEAVQYYNKLGAKTIGIDNNMRKAFFGPLGDTHEMLVLLKKRCKYFQHYSTDIRDREAIFAIFNKVRPDIIIHCAAQPSHDFAKASPLNDFEINALGTLNLLEATRQFTSKATFVFASTNKVYGNVPNELPLVELPTRWDYANEKDYGGISETCRIDHCLHSLFGASKLAADILCQEYGRYFGMNVGVFRASCMTGCAHAGVSLHGFLSYLIRVAVRDNSYTIIGYKGKQVRDQIHSFDVITAFDAFIGAPKQGEVYNLGGGRANSASIIECIDIIEQRLHRAIKTSYIEKPRIGDHVCYITNTSKMQTDYPTWKPTKSLTDIIDEMIFAEQERLHI